MNSNCTTSDNEGVSQRIPHIADALHRAHITWLQIKYDGSFDCGQVAEPTYLLSDGHAVPLGICKGLHEELHTFFRELLELRFPQWDNAEGSRGEFQWHVKSVSCRCVARLDEPCAASNSAGKSLKYRA
jgi:hypothetical protein